MNNFKKKELNSSNGITLIALVITIIVLLILAGISISMLAGDNSILQKTTDAKANTDKATVIELAQADILGQIAENNGENISKNQLKTILAIYFEDIATLELPDDLSGTTEKLTAKAKYGGYNNIALSDIYNGNLKIDPPPVINYGEKTATTVELGDTISINTESFIIIKNDGTTITALPIHNITLDETLPTQSIDSETIEFSTEDYWSDNEDINMDDSRNNIQKYILAYQNTLRSFGATNITTRVARYDELNEAFNNENYYLDDDGEFWTGTSRDNVFIWIAYSSGNFKSRYSSNYDLKEGVRPLIEITI